MFPWDEESSVPLGQAGICQNQMGRALLRSGLTSPAGIQHLPMHPALCAKRERMDAGGKGSPPGEQLPRLTRWKEWGLMGLMENGRTWELYPPPKILSGEGGKKVYSKLPKGRGLS